MRKSVLSFYILIFISISTQSQNILPPIIPKPVSMEFSGGVFRFDKNTSIYTSNPELISEIETFNSSLKLNHGFSLKNSKPDTKNSHIELVLSNDFPIEAYKIKMTPTTITIIGDEAGIFYGLKSIIQMLPIKIENVATLSCVEIYDYPRFSWRGMHLDVCRHFFSKKFILKYLDYMSDYKMNTFHWHLTDDQGWRIEIKKYPLLTKLGSWRKGTLIGHSSDEQILTDTATYGGFYTQDEIREIVEYAKKRHITIVPEIEMPGHSMAALKAYPYLSCTGIPQEMANTWGVFDHIFCTKDTVFDFIENVLSEVINLFPGSYIHIGGDECPKVNWKKCPVCQARIKNEGLKNEDELQSYFIQRIEKFLNSKHRKLIGWDEILDGGLAPNAAVMSWRGFEGGTAAAKLGHFVVMTPGSHCYFDYYQGDPTNEPLAIGGYTPLEKVYSFEPIPDSLNENEKKFILGAQANVWTEYIKNEEHLEYMIFPRLCALAEVVWTPNEKKDYNNFRQRLLKHFDAFENRKINYSKSIFEIKKTVIPDTSNQKIFIQFSQAFQMGDIQYWYENDTNKKTYIKQIPIEKSGVIYAHVIDKSGKIRGKAEQKFQISKSSGASLNMIYQPSPHYNYGSPYTLVDGISGRVPWNGKEWLGFSNTPMEAIVDLGKIQTISSVSIHTLKAEASWIYLPSSVVIEISKDGKEYTMFGKLNSDEIDKIGRIIKIQKGLQQTRFVKIHVERKGIISSGKPGEGNNAWLFISEIEVQ